MGSRATTLALLVVSTIFSACGGDSGGNSSPVATSPVTFERPISNSVLKKLGAGLLSIEKINVIIGGVRQINLTRHFIDVGAFPLRDKNLKFPPKWEQYAGIEPTDSSFPSNTPFRFASLMVLTADKGWRITLNGVELRFDNGDSALLTYPLFDDNLISWNFRLVEKNIGGEPVLNYIVRPDGALFDTGLNKPDVLFPEGTIGYYPQLVARSDIFVKAAEYIVISRDTSIFGKWHCQNSADGISQIRYMLNSNGLLEVNEISGTPPCEPPTTEASISNGAWSNFTIHGQIGFEINFPDDIKFGRYQTIIQPDVFNSKVKMYIFLQDSSIRPYFNAFLIPPGVEITSSQPSFDLETASTLVSTLEIPVPPLSN